MRQQDREQQAEAVQTLSQHSPLIQCSGNNPSCPITQSLKILASLHKMPHIKEGERTLEKRQLHWIGSFSPVSYCFLWCVIEINWGPTLGCPVEITVYCSAIWKLSEWKLNANLTFGLFQFFFFYSNNLPQAIDATQFPVVMQLNFLSL